MLLAPTNYLMHDSRLIRNNILLLRLHYMTTKKTRRLIFELHLNRTYTAKGIKLQENYILVNIYQFNSKKNNNMFIYLFTLRYI